MAKKGITVLDFGTSKIIAMQAEEISGKKLTAITSVGMAPYDGFMNDGWNDPSKVKDAIAAAIGAMEEKLNTQIKHAYVGVPGEFVHFYVLSEKVKLQGADPKVTPQDVDKLLRAATEALGNPTGPIIHRSAAWFRVDDGKKTLEPMGMKGSELEGMISFAVAEKHFVDDIRERLDELEIKPDGLYSTSVAEMLHLVPYEERDRTAILIDVGYLSTEVIAVEGDAVIWQKVIPFGGAHITVDLSYGFQKHFALCEKVKRGYSFSDTAGREIEVETEDGQIERFDGTRVDMIVKARVDEILEMIADAIDKSSVHIDKETVYYVTGGGIMTMTDARYYLNEKLKHNVREGKPKIERLKPSAVYASASALVELIFNLTDTQEQQEGGLFARIRRLFRKA